VSVRAISPRRNFRGLRILGIVAAAAIVTASWCAPVAASNWLEKTIYLWGPRFDSQIPGCDDSWALGTIQSRFATKEGRFWNSDLRIQSIEQVKEIAFRPWADGTIPRRFCTGRAMTSDGKTHTVRFSIVEDGGMIGANWGVQWCVVGLDRNWAYNPACKAAGP